MNPVVRLDGDSSREFGETIRRLQGATQKPLSELVEGQTRLTVFDLIKTTPPHAASPIQESFNTQRKAGESAIKHDLLGGGKHTGQGEKKAGIIMVVADDILKNKIHANSVKLWAKKDGTVYGVERTNWRPDASTSELLAHQKRYRSDATGRVTSAGARTRDVGRWKFVDKVVTSKSSWAAFYNILRARVGFAKAGWWNAGKELGVKSVPSWITRHNAPGTIINHLKDENPYCEVSNDVKYIQKLNGNAQLLERALRNRIRAMNITIEHAEKHFASKFASIK